MSVGFLPPGVLPHGVRLVPDSQKNPCGRIPGGKVPGGKIPGGKIPGGKIPGGKIPVAGTTSGRTMEAKYGCN